MKERKLKKRKGVGLGLLMVLINFFLLNIGGVMYENAELGIVGLYGLFIGIIVIGYYLYLKEEGQKKCMIYGFYLFTLGIFMFLLAVGTKMWLGAIFSVLILIIGGYHMSDFIINREWKDANCEETTDTERNCSQGKGRE